MYWFVFMFIMDVYVLCMIRALINSWREDGGTAGKNLEMKELEKEKRREKVV